MNDASIEIIRVLKERGYRITDARKSLANVLSNLKQPATMQELSKKVASDEASVYRTVRLLVEENLLEEILLQGEVSRYVLVHAHAHGHHHHAICEKCGFVAHIPCEAISVVKQIPKHFKKISSHEVTFYGLCAECA